MTEKPTTIPVREYYRENYILKVAKKECIVSVPGYASSWVEDVEDVHGMYLIKFQDHEGPHSFNFMPDDSLTVTWLPRPADSGATGEVRGLALEWVFGFDGALACLELVANGGHWQQWQQHRTDTRGIVTERAGKYIRKLQAELASAKAEAEALRTALEAIANKSDPEKPIRLDGETGTSYGRTYGQWEMAKIAREALQAGTEGG